MTEEKQKLSWFQRKIAKSMLKKSRRRLKKWKEKRLIKDEQKERDRLIEAIISMTADLDVTHDDTKEPISKENLEERDTDYLVNMMENMIKMIEGVI